MAEAISAADSLQRGGRLGTRRLAWLLVGMSLLAMLPGCGGCGCLRAKTQAELDQESLERDRLAELEKERQKPPLDVGFLCSEPIDARQKTNNFYCKPGHWTAAMLPAKANHEDLFAELELAVIDERGQPRGLTGTPYTFSTQRDVALQKKTPKQLQSQVFFPLIAEKTRVIPRITARGGGRLYEGPAQANPLLAHQYHWVVLASEPERYTYLDQLDSYHLPKDLMLEAGAHDLYRLVFQKAEKQTSLPGQSLFWTSTAGVLWDEAEPESLTLDQQQALLDWLHWGGQLVISGPNSLATLKDTFLGPYLPATAGDARAFQASDLEELGRHWPVRSDSPSLHPIQPWQGITLVRHPEARFVPGTGELVAERRVGRGRVVVSAFPLNESAVVGWRGFDAFFNACLLGHPGRKFSESEGQALLHWRTGGEIRDARRLCQLRYFTRDTGRGHVPIRGKDELDVASPDEVTLAARPTDVASWCDSNQVAAAAREALKDAARIEIPSSTFVVWVVGAYLVVLVPLNWIVFRTLNRVEWAWVAAPLIAVACTGLVIRLAQLDIGFARSATEIAVVELQGDYPRAHVTRYTALYTSLSTEYCVYANDPGAAILPFPNRLDDVGIRFGRTPLQHRYGQESELRGLRVLSNSTGLFHSEQMLELGGCTLVTTKEGGYELVNDTDLPLHGVGLLRLGEKEQGHKSVWTAWLKEQDRNDVWAAWIEEVPPHERRSVVFEHQVERKKEESREPSSPWNDQRNASPVTLHRSSDGSVEIQRSRTSGTLNIRRLIDLAEQGFLQEELRRPGDVRMIAWTEAPIPGMLVEPGAPQVRHAALVVADLCHGHLADPDSDSNTPKVLEAPARVLQIE